MSYDHATANPLHWPLGKPRTPASSRIYGRFARSERAAGSSWRSTRPLTVSDALSRLRLELERLRVVELVISTNVPLRADGFPRSDQREPQDPGAAVYFKLKAGGKPHCLPCDRYRRVADNLAAIAAHIEATRAIERYGVADLAAMFAGFQALPAPAQKTWREILGFVDVDAPPTLDQVERKFRELASEHHPDRGGNPEIFSDLVHARESARAELTGAH